VAFPCCLLHLPCPMPVGSRFQPADPSLQPRSNTSSFSSKPGAANPTTGCPWEGYLESKPVRFILGLFSKGAQKQST
jgi:hypothetical protein